MKNYTVVMEQAPRVGIIGACVRFFKDPDASMFDKAVLVIAPLYFVSPIDILPEILFGPFGFADDLGVLWYVLKVGARVYQTYASYEAHRVPLEHGGR